MKLALRARSSSFGRSLPPALVLVCAALGAVACASGDRDPELGAARSAISGGQPDSIDSNVFVVVSHRGTAGVALCSASLIAPNLLLTARHCVASVTAEVVTCGQTEASTPFPASTFFATNIQNLDNATSAFKATSVSVPSQGTDICGFDLALITLADVVPPEMATPLVPRIDRPVLRGETYSAIGYGQDSPGDAGIAGNRMDRDGLKVACAPGGCGEGVEASEFVGDTGICSGDSGGPALDSSGKVVGVVSRSADDCAHPVYGSVASWKDWIVGVATQAAIQGKYTAPFWVTTGSSDPPTPNSGSADSGSAGATGEPGSGAGSFGTQGDKCGSPQDCKTGFGCYSPTGVATNAYCAELCTPQTACGLGTHCQASIGVCIAGTGAAQASSSCAVAQPGGPNGPAGLGLFGLTWLGLAGWWRRRASRRRGPNFRSTEGS